jgi:hypothetical protein
MDMNIKALITALVIVGSSSVAMARPAATVSANAQITASASWSYGTPSRVQVRDRDRVRDHRSTTKPWSPMWQTANYDSYDYNRNDRFNRFDLLAEELNFGAGEYRKDIMPSAVDRFSKLRVSADSGRTYIMKVVVEFADGTQQQQINIDKTLRAGESLDLDLVGSTHTIGRILVYRADNYDLRHFNEVHRGEFSVLAL